jgi:hypothetical protein
VNALANRNLLFVYPLRQVVMSDTPKDYWSDCSQICFLDGYGWGVTDTGDRICLGREADILNCFKTRELNEDLHSKQREVLMQIQEYREENGFGDVRAESVVGESAARPSRNRQKNTRHLETGKRTAIRQVNR